MFGTFVGTFLEHLLEHVLEHVCYMFETCLEHLLKHCVGHVLQHVLEALSGYLALAYNLHKKPKLSGDSFNFSNNDIKNINVKNFLLKFKKKWKNSKWKIEKNKSFHENSLLQLNCNKSKKILKWKNRLNLSKTISLTSEWYLHFYDKKKCLTFQQLKYFMKIK